MKGDVLSRAMSGRPRAVGPKRRPMPGVRERAGPERPHEVRNRPPRGGAWLSGDTVSRTNRVSTFGKQKTPPRNTLFTPGVMTRVAAGRRPRGSVPCTTLPDTHRIISSSEACAAGHLNLPRRDGREPAESRLGCPETGTYVTTLECISSNAGSGHGDAKAGSRPTPRGRGGAAVVVRGRESRPHGAGRSARATAKGGSLLEFLSPEHQMLTWRDLHGRW